MSDTPSPRDQYLSAVAVLEHTMVAENWFLEAVRSEIDANRPRDAGELKKALNHDFIVHLAQFLFLFRAIDCHDRGAVMAFISAHNDKVRADIEAGTVRGSLAEKKKAIFSDTRKTKVVESCHAVGAPAFAITELAHFLTDFMAEASASRMISDLVYAQVLTRAEDPRPDAAPSRELIRSTGFLEETYAQSLLMMRDAVAALPGAGVPGVTGGQRNTTAAE